MTQLDAEMMTVGGMLVAPVEDNDVAAERERIINTPVEQLATTDTVILRQLTKLFDNSFLAVDRLSVGIPKGECFGLLGVNGAGKTTTFAMLTSDITVSSGDAFLAGMGVGRGVAGESQRQVGFCPQFDALIDQMTVRETLWMFARLRGIHAGDISRVVEKLINQLTLEEYADREAGKLRYPYHVSSYEWKIVMFWSRLCVTILSTCFCFILIFQHCPFPSIIKPHSLGPPFNLSLCFPSIITNAFMPLLLFNT